MFSLELIRLRLKREYNILYFYLVKEERSPSTFSTLNILVMNIFQTRQLNLDNSVKLLFITTHLHAKSEIV